jgi:simple sugar transport system substrate-binding protein
MEGISTHRHLLRRRAHLVAVTLIAILATVAAGCTSGSTKQDGQGSTETATGNANAAGNGKVSIVVIGGKSDDPFWSAVKRGGEDAAKVVQAAGGTVTFLGPQNYDNLGPDEAKLQLTALSQNPSAVVGPDWIPDNQNEAWKQITAKGIPVFLYNAGGVAQAKEIGALKYVGSDDYEAGKAGGVKFAEVGQRNILCVNTVPGSANQEARCKGVADGAGGKGAKSSQLALPSSNFGNPSAVTQAVKAALLADTTIDAVVTIGVQDADSAAGAIEQGQLSGKVKLGTFDVSQSQLDRIKAGKQVFAIDQQPYLQGYYAVSLAFQYVSYGLFPPQNPILTGPLLITADNIDAAIAGTRSGVR